MADWSVAEAREQALAEAWALRAEAKLQLLASHVPARGWDVDVLCKGATEVFFPRDDAGRGAYDKARSVCSGCRVALSCLASNLDERHGGFAGTTPEDRRDLRRALRRAGLGRRHITATRRDKGRRPAA